MNYLEKLKTKISLPKELSLLPKVKISEKEPTSRTALTAKSTFGTLDSTRGSHFSRNEKQIPEAFDLSEKTLQQQQDELWKKADDLADWIDDSKSDVPWQERAARVLELQEMSAEIDRLMVQQKGIFQKASTLINLEDFSPISNPGRKIQIGLTLCPARCKQTGKCYGQTYFDGKPGKAEFCTSNQCPWSDQLEQYRIVLEKVKIKINIAGEEKK